MSRYTISGKFQGGFEKSIFAMTSFVDHPQSTHVQSHIVDKHHRGLVTCFFCPEGEKEKLAMNLKRQVETMHQKSFEEYPQNISLERSRLGRQQNLVTLPMIFSPSCRFQSFNILGKASSKSLFPVELYSVDARNSVVQKLEDRTEFKLRKFWELERGVRVANKALTSGCYDIFLGICGAICRLPANQRTCNVLARNYASRDNPPRC